MNRPTNHTRSFAQLSRLSLRRRLQIGFLIAGILLGFMGLVSYNYIEGQGRAYQEVLQKSLQVAQFLIRTQDQLLRLGTEERKLISGDDLTGIQENVGTRITEILAELDALSARFTEAGDRASLQDVRKEIEDYAAVVRLASPSSRPSDRRQIAKEAQERRYRLFSLFRKDPFAGWHGGEKAAQQAGLLRARTQDRLLVVMALSLVFLALLGVFFPRNIVFPLRRLEQNLSRLSEGRLDLDLAPTGDREIDQLQDTLSHGLARLRRFDELKSRRIQDETLKFKRLADLLPQLVLVLDGHRRLVFANHRAFSTLGLSFDESVGREITELNLSPSFTEECRESLRQGKRIDRMKLELGGLPSHRKQDFLMTADFVRAQDAGEEVTWGVFVLQPIE